MAMYLLKYLRSDGSVISTKKMNFRMQSMAYAYAQTLLSKAYGELDSIDVTKVGSKSAAKRRTSSKSGYDHKKELASFSAEIDRIKASLKKKANKRKS